MRLLLPLVLACGPTPQRYVSLPARAIVLPVTGVTFTEAYVEYGPVYFCASITPCEQAAAELLTTTRIDLMNPTAQSLGDVQGLTGDVRSLMYDYGISWTSTQGAPGGTEHSVVLKGSKDGVPFDIALDVKATQRGLRAASARATGTIVEGASLEVIIDPNPWLANPSEQSLVNFPPTVRWNK